MNQSESKSLAIFLTYYLIALSCMFIALYGVDEKKPNDMDKKNQGMESAPLDLSIRNNEGENAFDLAKNNPEILKLLLEYVSQQDFGTVAHANETSQ